MAGDGWGVANGDGQNSPATQRHLVLRLRLLPSWPIQEVICCVILANKRKVEP